MTKELLGFGLMRLPVLDDDPTHIDIGQLCEMVDLFLENGFVCFDTSFVYHGGASEKAIKKALVDRHPRDGFSLATKLPAFIIKEKRQAVDIFKQQLENCGTGYFDRYLLHNLNGILYDSCAKTCELFEYMLEQKRLGRIKCLGFSFHDSAEVLDRILIDHPEVDFVQIALNYYDWNSYMIQSRKCYEVIRKHGKDVVVMEPVKGGMLADVPEEIRAEMESIHPGASPASWAIRYAASLEGVSTVLSGMSDLDQVRDNVSYMREFIPVGPEERDVFSRAVSSFKKSGPLNEDDFSKYEDLEANGMPVAAVLDTYNSCMVQPNPYFVAEHNYYRGIRYANRIEPGKSWIKGRILTETREDITEKVKEAETFLLEHGF